MIIAKGKEHLEHREYTFAEGHSIRGVILRELDGDDELEAGRMGRSRKALDDEEAMRHVLFEQLRLSVVATRATPKGPWQPVAQPFDGMDKWKQRTINLVGDAFQRMNMLAPGEVEAFHQGARVIGAPSPAAKPQDDEVVEE